LSRSLYNLAPRLDHKAAPSPIRTKNSSANLSTRLGSSKRRLVPPIAAAGTRAAPDRPRLRRMLDGTSDSKTEPTTRNSAAFVVRYGYGEAANWRELEDAARQVISGYRYAPDGLELSPCPAALAAQVVR